MRQTPWAFRKRRVSVWVGKIQTYTGGQTDQCLTLATYIRRLASIFYVDVYLLQVRSRWDRRCVTFFIRNAMPLQTQIGTNPSRALRYLTVKSGSTRPSSQNSFTSLSEYTRGLSRRVTQRCSILARWLESVSTQRNVSVGETS